MLFEERYKGLDKISADNYQMSNDIAWNQDELDVAIVVNNLWVFILIFAFIPCSLVLVITIYLKNTVAL
jgi:hypothetical protein